MADIVCLSSEDEMEIQDIVEVIEEIPSCNKKPVLHKTRNLNHHCKSQKISTGTETEMRISISKTHSDTLGDSTQVKIVIPSTSGKPNFQSSNGSSATQSSTSSFQNDAIKNNPRKRTARKTLSSFTPRKQFCSSSKHITTSVVTLDSDDEIDYKDDQTMKKYMKLEEVPMPSTSFTTLTSLVNKSDTVNVSQEQCPATSPIVKKDKIIYNSDEKIVEISLEKRKDLFATECKKYLTCVEYEKVNQKLQKRILAISDHHKNNSRLHGFLTDRINNLIKDSKDLQKQPRSIFLVIRDVLDELTKYGSKNSSAPASTCSISSQQKTTQVNESKSSTQPGSSDVNSEEVVSETPSTSQPAMTERQVAKRKLHIKKLENALKACGREVARIEEAGMSLDEMYDENSGYIKVSKYKARYMKIYRKIAELRELNASLARKQDTKFKTEASRIPEINQQIEKMVNRDKIFPDFSDILKLFKNHYLEKSIVVQKEMIEAEAKDTFLAVGHMLISRRKHDDLDVMLSYIPSDEHDPAINDPELKRNFEESSKIAETKMNKLMSDFVMKQIESKEEAEEVPDDNVVNENAEHSLSSEEDSENDSSEESEGNDDNSIKADIDNM